MSFTGVLGTSFSQLGNLVLGDGPASGSGYDNSLNLDCTASISRSYTYDTGVTLSLNVTSNFAILNNFPEIVLGSVAYYTGYIPIVHDFTSIPGTFRSQLANIRPAFVPSSSGIIYTDSIALDVTASYSTILGFAGFPTLSIDCTASITRVVTQGLAASISIDCQANIDTSTFNIFSHLVTLPATASITIGPNLVIPTSILIGAVGSYTTPGGILYNPMLELDATAFASVLSGFGYFKSVELDATVSYSQVDQYLKNANTQIDCTASIDITSLIDFANTVPIHGTASLTTSPITDYVITTPYHVTSYYYPETIYEFLVDIIVVASTVASTLHFIPSNIETPASVVSLSVQSQLVANRTVTQTITFGQTVRGFHDKIANNQTLVFAQTASVQKFKAATVTQTFSMTQEAFRIYPISQSLAIIQTVTPIHVHNLNVAQTFVIHQQALKRSIYNRTTSNILVFNPNKTIKLPLFGLQHPNLPVQQLEYAYHPAYVARLSSVCTVVFSVPQRAIVLPCARLGDSQAYTGTMTLKRTMTGDTYTYVKRSQTSKLKYLFWLGRQKGLEFRDFIISYNSQLITLLNWKGETWYGFFSSNPFELVTAERWQNAGERVDVTIEFEGIKIGG
jgi:hypothetical protein